MKYSIVLQFARILDIIIKGSFYEIYYLKGIMEQINKIENGYIMIISNFQLLTPGGVLINHLHCKCPINDKIQIKFDQTNKDKDEDKISINLQYYLGKANQHDKKQIK